MRYLWQIVGQPYERLAEFLRLSTAVIELENIGDRSYVSLPSLGISAVLPDNATIGALQLHVGGHEGFSEYNGELSYGLSFTNDRDHVRAVLGKPTGFGQVTELPVLGLKPAWDMFAIDDMTVHVEYALDGGWIRMITIR